MLHTFTSLSLQAPLSPTDSKARLLTKDRAGLRRQGQSRFSGALWGSLDVHKAGSVKGSTGLCYLCYIHSFYSLTQPLPHPLFNFYFLTEQSPNHAFLHLLPQGVKIRDHLQTHKKRTASLRPSMSLRYNFNKEVSLPRCTLR